MLSPYGEVEGIEGGGSLGCLSFSGVEQVPDWKSVFFPGCLPLPRQVRSCVPWEGESLRPLLGEASAGRAGADLPW